MSFLFALYLPALLLAADGGAEATLTNFRVALQGQRVEASFRLENGLSQDMIEKIETGLPTGFEFEFRLFRDRKRWWDHGVDSSRLEVVAMYNAVTRGYLVNYKQDGNLINSRVVLDREELRRAMTQFDEVFLFSIDQVDGRRRLLVRARAKLGSRNLFKIIPTDITTDWVESKKFLPPSSVD